MKARIRNFIGVAKADLEIETGITLVAGDNAVGKTSVLRALGVLLTGQVKLQGLGSADALVMDGASEAELLLTDHESAASITYPSPKYVAQNLPPQASLFAAGILAYTDLNERERAHFLTHLLEATPPPAAVRKALKDDVAEEDIVAVLELLEKHGWDEAWERLKERRVKLKGKWEEVTGGERWGDSKAKDWVPEGWDERTDAAHAKPTLRVTAAQAALDLANREAVMGEAEYQQLHDMLGKREPTQMSLDMALRQLPTIEAEWARLRQELEALPPPVEPGIPCPHCGAFVVVRGDKLEPLEPPDPQASELRKEAIAVKRELVRQAYGKLEVQQGVIGACKEKLREIARAEEKLRGARKGNGEDQGDRLAKLKATLEIAQASAARARQAKEAQDIAERVRFHSTLIDALSPDGLRRQAMEKKLDQLEAELLGLTQDLITWKPICIDRKTLLPTFGGRPYVLCSRSEQWRINATLQVAIALREGAAAIVMDGADILTQAGQDDLFADLLLRLPVPCIVGASYDRPKDAPDLAKAGIGRVYWISDGVIGGPDGRPGKSSKETTHGT